MLANAKATVRFGLPSGIGPVGIPNLFKSFTIFDVDLIADSPCLFIIEHTSRILGSCGNGGNALVNNFVIDSHICFILITF